MDAKSNNQRPNCLIIAHRGSSKAKPENSLAAFHQARLDQADGIELDVQLTKDGQLVVFHDRSTKRFDPRDLVITKSVYNELKKTNLGIGETIPKLSDVLEEAKTWCKVINVEIKNDQVVRSQLEKKLASLLKSMKLLDQVLISSFNPFALLRIKKLLPTIKIGFLVTKEQPRALRSLAMIKKVGPHTMNLYNRVKDDERMQSYTKIPKPQWIWTVDELPDFQYWTARGVEAIITNVPKTVRGFQ